MDSCNVCESQATGICPSCSQKMCLPCYNLHACPHSPQEVGVPGNVQCSVCAIDPALYLCLCQFPCLSFCQACCQKHMENPALHYQVDIQYRGCFTRYEEFMRRKTRMTTMQNLHQRINDSLYQMTEFQHHFEASFNQLLDQLAHQRQTLLAEVDRSKALLSQQEEILRTYFLSFLLADEDCGGSGLGKIVEEGFNDETVGQFQRHLDFSEVTTALNKVAWFKCELLEALVRPGVAKSEKIDVFSLSAPSVSKPRQCCYCLTLFSLLPQVDQRVVRPELLHLRQDFCSQKCLIEFQMAFVVER